MAVGAWVRCRVAREVQVADAPATPSVEVHREKADVDRQLHLDTPLYKLVPERAERVIEAVDSRLVGAVEAFDHAEVTAAQPEVVALQASNPAVHALLVEHGE